MSSLCFGLPLREGANIIAIVNSLVSICYIIYYIWEYKTNYGYPKISSKEFNHNGILFPSEGLDEVFLNYITLVFMLFGFTSLFASFGLKQATLKNETHKIYFWLLVGCVQLGTIVTIEFFMLVKHTTNAKEVIGLIASSTLIDTIMIYQLIVIKSFYSEEKLVEETNYSRLRSELSSQLQEQQMDEEFQNVELGAL